MAKSEAKKGIGIGLRPSLWERIDAYAELQGKSRTQVVEAILEAHIPCAPDSRKTQQSSPLHEDSLELAP